jgi:DNA-binding transcriptional ArsR family regulator
MTTIRFDPKPAYEFLLTLVAWATPQRVDSYAVGQAWFAETSAALPDDLRRRIATLANGCDHVFSRLLGVAVDLEPPGTAAQLVDAVEAMPPATLRLSLLGYYARRTRRRIDPERIVEAARGDPAAVRAVLELTTDGPECERAIGAILGQTDAQVHATVVAILRAWEASVFRAHIETVGPLLDEETAHLRGRLQELGTAPFLDEAANGTDLLATPRLEEIAVFPTWILRPWNVFWEQGASLLLGVPVAEHRLGGDPDAPPERLVQLAKALGDERRLRVLRRLTTGSYTLQELADHFAVSKTTLLHHLVILRSAGIVRVEAGANGRYSLRAGMPTELNRLVEGYLPAVRRAPVGAGIDERG